MIGLPHDDCEQRELQCSQDDAERDACSKSDCISDESGGCCEVVIAPSLHCLFRVWSLHAIHHLMCLCLMLPFAGRDFRDLIQCDCF